MVIFVKKSYKYSIYVLLKSRKIYENNQYMLKYKFFFLNKRAAQEQLLIVFRWKSNNNYRNKIHKKH